MKLAFCAYKVFPYGGLSRDLIQIALACQSRGHAVHVFVREWQGPVPPGFNIQKIKSRGFSNPAKNTNYQLDLAPFLDEAGFDVVIGFNKMPGLDIYYAADSCFKQKALVERGRFFRMSRRCRAYLRDEASVFGDDADALCLLLSRDQKQHYSEHYRTPEQRLIMLPPSIAKDRRPIGDTAAKRAAFRREFGLADDDKVILMVGSGYKTKGLDRAIKALAGLDQPLRCKTWLYVVGEDKSAPFERLASKLGVRSRVRFFGARDDVPSFLLGADMLLQPSIQESAGAAILEAMVCGLPVLATDVCGNATHIEQANAGKVMPSPFDERVFTRLLTEVLTSPERPAWSQNGLRYGLLHDLYSMPDTVADIIDAMIKKRHVGTGS